MPLRPCDAGAATGTVNRDLMDETEALRVVGFGPGTVRSSADRALYALRGFVHALEMCIEMVNRYKIKLL